MTSQLQRRFSNNITTLCRRLLMDVFFATLLQRRDMVERRRDIKQLIITSSRGRVFTGYLLFYFKYFLTKALRKNPYIIELIRLEFLVQIRCH